MREGEMEEYEFDPDSKEIRAVFVNQVAKAIFLGKITDDNPSPSSGKTSLDQILEWEFDVEGDEEMEQLRTEILVRVSELKGGCDMFEYEDFVF